MNIFALSEDPKECAQMHCDKHVVKMILETAQLLSTAVQINNRIESIYKPTHINHPSSIWTRESTGNFLWLIELGNELCNEYTFRYEKIHKSKSIITECKNFIMNIKFGPRTKFALAMPDEYKTNDPVESYRKYYIGEKSPILKYTKRNPPDWIKSC